MDFYYYLMGAMFIGDTVLSDFSFSLREFYAGSVLQP